MLAEFGDICVYCGHPGATEAGHLIAVALDPDQPIDPQAMRPAHGTSARCPHCPPVWSVRLKRWLGRACNQEFGTKRVADVFKPRMHW